MKQSDHALEIGKQEERSTLSRCFLPIVCQFFTSALEILSTRDHRQTHSSLYFPEGKGLCMSDRKDETAKPKPNLVAVERLQAPSSMCTLAFVCTHVVYARCCPGVAYRDAAEYPCCDSLSVIQGYLSCAKTVRRFQICFV